MAKVSSFAIFLDKSRPIFYPGESISGKLSFQVKERLKVSHVGLVAIGDAYCQWENDSKPKKTKKNKTAPSTGNYGYELFYKFEHVFVSKKKDDKEFYLEPGDYSHDFRIFLPPVLPSSYENPNARIRYEFIGTIQLDGEPSLHTNKTITVISHLDLNQIAGVGQPSVTSQSENVGYCCRSDQLDVTLATRKSGFVPGEMILVDITVDNHQSARAIKAPVINFVESVILFTISKNRTVTRTISTLNLPRDIPANEIEEFNGLCIEVPSICPSSFCSTQVLQLSYYLKLEFESKGPKIMNDLVIPLVIGTCPINDYYSILPPYVYQICVFGPNSAQFATDHSTKGQLIQSDSNTFVPYYPYYQLPSAPPRPLTPLVTTPPSTTPMFTPRISSPLVVTSNRAGFDDTVQGSYESLTPIYITLKPDPQKDGFLQDDAQIPSSKPAEPVYVALKKAEEEKPPFKVDADTQTTKDVKESPTETPIPKIKP